MNLNSVWLLVIVLILLAGTITYLLKENQDLKVKNKDLTVNNKALHYGLQAYKDNHGKEHSVSIEQIQTMEDLHRSEDSIAKKMIANLEAAKIKLKKVRQSGYVRTEVKHDTLIVMASRDTSYDLSQKPHLIEVVTVKGNLLTRHLEIYNEQFLNHVIKRETVNPPKKFFIARWLQKKHDVTYVDIVNSNPLIKTTKQTFIITK